MWGKGIRCRLLVPSCRHRPLTSVGFGWPKRRSRCPAWRPCSTAHGTTWVPSSGRRCRWSPESINFTSHLDPFGQIIIYIYIYYILYIWYRIVLSNCACPRMFTSGKKWRNNAKKWNWKMQIWKRHTWQLRKKMGKHNASWKEAKIANGGKNRKRIHGRNRCKLEGGDTICGEYRQMKCNQGKGKMPNAFAFACLNLRYIFIFDFYLFCIAFLHCIFCAFMSSSFLHILSAVAFCLHF